MTKPFFVLLPATRKRGVVNLSLRNELELIGTGNSKIIRLPLPFARPRRPEISRIGDELISIDVGQCKIDSERHRGAIKSAALAEEI
jgi:hypothetical protein